MNAREVHALGEFVERMQEALLEAGLTLKSTVEVEDEAGSTARIEHAVSLADDSDWWLDVLEVATA